MERPEDAVGLGELVAELDELGLQVGDVVAGERGRRTRGPACGRRASSGPPRSACVGLGADRAVDGDAAALLEVADGELGRVVEASAESGVGVVQQPDASPACCGPRRRRCRSRRVAGAASSGCQSSGSGRARSAAVGPILPQRLDEPTNPVVPAWLTAYDRSAVADDTRARPRHPEIAEWPSGLGRRCRSADQVGWLSRRNSVSSRRIAAFGRAPTIVLTISPLWNTAMVGMDMTW